MSRFAKLFLMMFAAVSFIAAADVTVTDETISGDYHMTADNTYYLDGFVFVESGSTLTIDPGTVIKARQTSSTGDASALIVARGAKIMANGTRTNPIVMTSDAVDNGTLTWADRGLWGGLVILGNATTNRGVEGQIEGIPSDETRGAYGGEDDHDNSGVLRFVSIRHGGSDIGAGNEINGLTLGAVGDGTTIEYVEIFSNADDGVEWFGGTVNCRYLAVAFCADDSFDWDEGFRGKNQFWFAIQAPDKAGRIGEHDGGTVQETAEPYATPFVLNSTYIGPGSDAFPEGDGGEAVIFRDNSGGHYWNNIMTQYNGANGGLAVTVEDLPSGEDSRARLEAGDLTIVNNIVWDFGAGDIATDYVPQDFVQGPLLLSNNQPFDPMLNSVSRDADGLLDPRPAAAGIAANGSRAVADSAFQSVPYYGAFDPNAELWIAHWTALDAYGHLADTSVQVEVGARWIGHVTAYAGGFRTDLRFLNRGDAPEVVGITPYDANGNAMAGINLTVGANGSYTDARGLFGNEAVSHFAVNASDNISVSASYNIADGSGASAEVAAAAPAASSWAVYPANWDVALDGMALVNAGDAAATVTLQMKDTNGVVLGEATLSTDLAPGAKLLDVFSSHFDYVPGSVIEIHSTQTGLLTALRFVPGITYVTNPLVLQ